MKLILSFIIVLIGIGFVSSLEISQTNVTGVSLLIPQLPGFNNVTASVNHSNSTSWWITTDLGPIDSVSDIGSGDITDDGTWRTITNGTFTFPIHVKGSVWINHSTNNDGTSLTTTSFGNFIIKPVNGGGGTLPFVEADSTDDAFGFLVRSNVNIAKYLNIWVDNTYTNIVGTAGKTTTGFTITNDERYGFRTIPTTGIEMELAVGDFMISDTDPNIWIYDENQAVNSRKWVFDTSGEEFRLALTNDAWIGHVGVFNVKKDGLDIVSTTFPNQNLIVSGNLTLDHPSVHVNNNHLFVDGNITNIGDLNQSNGNATINMIYGEMYNYTSAGSPFTFIIAAANTYYNLTNLSAGDLNGFTFTGATNETGGSYLTAQVSGLYQMTFTSSFAGASAGGLYGFSISHNWNESKHRDCYARREARGDVGNVGVSCLMDIEIGDNVSIRVENENANRNILFHTVNLNIHRIGDMP